MLYLINNVIEYMLLKELINNGYTKNILPTMFFTMTTLKENFEQFMVLQFPDSLLEITKNFKKSLEFKAENVFGKVTLNLYLDVWKKII
jgi:hypothetical protein